MNNTLTAFLASFLIWIMFAGLLVLWAIDGRIKKEQVLHALFAAILAWLIAQMVKNLFPALRPFEADGTSPLTMTIPSDSSFPSGHSAAAFGLSVAIWLHARKTGYFYLFLAVLVGAARVYANVHYPLDIVGGAFLGVVVALAIDRLHVFGLLKGGKKQT